MWGNFDKFKESKSPAAFMDTYIRYTKAMLQYRLSPSTFWEPQKGPDGKWDFSNVDRFLSETVPLGLTTYNIGGNGTLEATRNTDLLTAYAAHLKARGWWNLHYVYGHDEAAVDLANSLRINYGTLLNAQPDVKVLQVGWNPDPRLDEYVRIWCQLTSLIDLDKCREAEKNGDEIWWYVCCGPTAPYANLFVDYPGIDQRILGWMTYSYGIRGLLYWGMDVWPGNDSKLDVYDKANYSNWNPNSFGRTNGDGYLFYPGHGDSPLPSIRLALLRDGIEDYDLFSEVKALADTKGGAYADRAKKLLEIKAPLISSLTQYTQNGDDLLARREAIMQAAEDLLHQ
jgi:hypothetical protein